MGKLFYFINLAILGFVFVYCEFMIYFLVISKCKWPALVNASDSQNTEKVLILADTHLLGPRYGHWFDKLRREWQMHRAFQSAVYIFHPSTVVMLGDIFDEGQWSDSEQFSTYLNRFKSLFSTSPDIEVIVAPGNHDVGFHYVMTHRLVSQFHDAFNLTSVQLRTIKKSHYIIINSMAFEGDDCDFCISAERQLWSIGKKLDCGKDGKCADGRPIVLQHFPMYRSSDSKCNEPDEAPSEIKGTNFKEKWDCLSEKASEKIYNWMQPRLIFTGHTHHGCHTVHRQDIHEYTVPSFSWRNKDNPSFILAVISPQDHAVQRCLMPRESTVIFIYTWTAIIIFVSIVIRLSAAPIYSLLARFMRRKKTKHR